MAYNRQQQHSREAYRSFEPLQYHRNAFWGNNMVSRSVFGFHLHGFCGFREPVEDVSRDGMDFNWKHQHSRVNWGSFKPLQYLKNMFLKLCRTLGMLCRGRSGWNRCPEACCSNVVDAGRFPVLKVLNLFTQIFIISYIRLKFRSLSLLDHQNMPKPIPHWSNFRKIIFFHKRPI